MYVKIPNSKFQIPNSQSFGDASLHEVIRKKIDKT